MSLSGPKIRDIHRIATPADQESSHIVLRKQNLELQSKRRVETTHLRQEVTELKATLDMVSKEKAKLEVELFEQTHALKLAFNKQETELRQARVEKMMASQPQGHDPQTYTASQYERQHGALGGAAYHERALAEEAQALRTEVVQLKSANTAMHDELHRARTRVRRLQALQPGMPAEGLPADHARLARSMAGRVEELEMELRTRAAAEGRLLSRSASLGQYVAPFSCRSPRIAGSVRSRVLREQMHLEPVAAPGSPLVSGRGSPPPGRGAPADALRGSPTSIISAAPAPPALALPLSPPSSPTKLPLSPLGSPARQRLKEPLPHVPVSPSRPPPPPSWRDALARATAALRALAAAPEGGAPDAELHAFREAFRGAARVLAAAGLASVEDVTEEHGAAEGAPGAPAAAEVAAAAAAAPPATAG